MDKQKNFLRIAKAALHVHFEEEFTRKAIEVIRRKRPEAPLALVGGGTRQFEKIEKLANEDVVDFVSLSRPLLKNPFLVRHFYQSWSDRSDRINCGGCLLNLEEGLTIW
jgi:2,4-dienoyl-CoA reductase-like NADH-dependent reductase (Old Yellow Enzyme family)